MSIECNNRQILIKIPAAYMFCTDSLIQCFLYCVSRRFACEDILPVARKHLLISWINSSVTLKFSLFSWLLLRYFKNISTFFQSHSCIFRILFQVSLFYEVCFCSCKNSQLLKGLRVMSSLTHYLPVSTYDDRGSKFKFYIKKGSMKKFPMSVATMRR